MSVFPQGDINPGLQPYIDIATTDLAKRLDVAPGDIEVVSAVTVVWGDRSLGCPQPDMQYAQIPEDGSLIELRAAGRIHRYHSGGSRGPFACEQPMPVAPRRIG